MIECSRCGTKVPYKEAVKRHYYRQLEIERFSYLLCQNCNNTDEAFKDIQEIELLLKETGV